jgi:hypothetical protein
MNNEQHAKMALEIFWDQIDMARQTGDDTDLIFRPTSGRRR